MGFHVGQFFTMGYPPEAAQWCNGNSAVIVQVEGGFEIQASPAPTLEDQLAAIEAKYSQKQTEIDSALVNALWVGGPQEASIRGSLMAKRQKIIDDRDAEIAALFA